MLFRPWSFALLVTCALVALPLACTPSSTGTDGADGGAEGEGEGEELEPVPYCRSECTTAADCALVGGPPHIDEDNYACVEGACEYLGCLREAECDALGASPDTFTCYREPGAAIRLCVRQCATVSDCIVEGATGAQDADNYECDDGACRYLGCRNDAECVTSLGAGAICVREGMVTPACALGCETAADCVTETSTAPFDENNYECASGACRWIGCVSDDECSDVGENLICR